MVQSKASTVDAYLEEAPEARREALTRLRFKKPGQIDFDLVRALLRTTATTPGTPC